MKLHVEQFDNGYIVLDREYSCYRIATNEDIIKELGVMVKSEIDSIMNKETINAVEVTISIKRTKSI